MRITKLSIAFLLCRYVQWLFRAAACQLFIACTVNLQLSHHPSAAVLPPYRHHKSHPGSLRFWSLTGHQMDIVPPCCLQKMYFILPFGEPFSEEQL